MYVHSVNDRLIFCLLSKAYAGSDIGVLSFGSPINGSALLIILLHQVIESRTLVSQSFTVQICQPLCCLKTQCV